MFTTRVSSNEYDWALMEHPIRTKHEDMIDWNNRCFDAEMMRLEYVNNTIQMHELSKKVPGAISKYFRVEMENSMVSRRQPGVYYAPKPPFDLKQFLIDDGTHRGRVEMNQKFLKFLEAIDVDPDTECPGVFLNGNKLCTYCGTGHECEHVLVFDTETTGLRSKDVVVEIGYAIYTKDGTFVRGVEEYWKTDAHIHPKAQAVHGITRETLRKHGRCPKQGMTRFVRSCERVIRNGGKIVAHNAKFDLRLLKQTMQRCGRGFPRNVLSDRNVLCTLNALRPMRQMLGGKLKNVHIFKRLGGSEDMFEGNAHRALFDCRITGYVFFKGLERHWWSL